MSDTTKALTEAQKRHLIALNDEVLRAQHPLNVFVSYLREEHQAPAETWMIRDVTVGFEPIPEIRQSERSQPTDN